LTLTELLLYTPALQFFVVFFYLFRSDFGRLLGRFRERSGLETWAKVLSQLDVIDGKYASVPGAQVRKAKSVALRLAGTLVTPILVVDLVVDPLLLPHLPSGIPFASLAAFGVPFFLQFVPAYLFVMFNRKAWFGPLHHGRWRTGLPGKRLGSRVRHLVDGVGKIE
jgi:hypothetical protein